MDQAIARAQLLARRILDMEKVGPCVGALQDSPVSLEIPSIAPVASDVHRPLWSVMIPAYNCARYLRQSLESVLVQDLGPSHMQIEVVDDRSTEDDPEKLSVR